MRVTFANANLAGSSLAPRLTTAAALALSLGACSTGFKLMPPPVYVDTPAYEVAATDLYETTGAGSELEIFYATDRAPHEKGEPCNYSRSRGDRLRLGTATMQIGETGWTLAELENHIKTGEELLVDCLNNDELGPLYSTIPPTGQDGIDAFYSESMDDPVRAPSKDFAERLNAQMERTRFPEINIFVSGLSTSFGNSIKHATALHHYTLRSGAMIAYPWPVGSTPLSASKDRLSGRVSARSLRNLLLFLADHTDAERINIIAYSGGAEVAAYALYQLRLAYAGQPTERILKDLRLGNVILASPDTDYMEFRNMLMDGLLDVAERFTVYVNPSDQVIVFSEKFSAGAPRLGNPGGVSEVEAQIYRDSDQIVFVSPERGETILGAADSLGHQYWYRNPWVSSDVLLGLTTRLPPAKRGLVRREGDVLWDFPDDYEARTEALLQRFLEEGASP